MVSNMSKNYLFLKHFAKISNYFQTKKSFLLKNVLNFIGVRYNLKLN
uniref:Uncharacterized protein n=1 Tax=Myoviridae sp. ctNQV2 TaxID=2827683 RepID=A0A8S5RZJ6_9CAUD|nr:MAG TPA: hypothetical protein [Myoviridae sp. ctNQV2]